MLVYISGPITGTTDYIKRFWDAERKLRDAGHTVINMAKVSEALPAGLPHDTYMAAGMALLSKCEAICMLPGWVSSEGAGMEYDYARRTGMKVVDLETGKEVEG